MKFRRNCDIDLYFGNIFLQFPINIDFCQWAVVSLSVPQIHFNRPPPPPPPPNLYRPPVGGSAHVVNRCSSRTTFNSTILLSRLLYITEGKYWNQLKKFRKFRVVLTSGSHETGSTAKKVTASDSAKPGPHTHIIFLESGVTGTCRNGDKE